MQSTSTIVMIRPASFGYNEQTAVNNSFQNTPGNTINLQKSALREFDNMVARLGENHLDVWVFDDTVLPTKPDAIFPNNWFTCHDATIHLYPMFAENRRAEKRKDIVDEIKKKANIKKVIDWSLYEQTNQFLEGTGSLVIDHDNKVLYACISPRTNKILVEKYAGYHGYTPVIFSATDHEGRGIYHTNVLMCVGSGFAVICPDAISNDAERKYVLSTLIESSHEVIPISFEQMNSFAGNMLQLADKKGSSLLLMSRNAHDSLSRYQVGQLEKFSNLLIIDVPLIEKTSGGSVRCMVAEIFTEK